MTFIYSKGQKDIFSNLFIWVNNICENITYNCNHVNPVYIFNLTFMFEDVMFNIIYKRIKLRLVHI